MQMSSSLSLGLLHWLLLLPDDEQTQDEQNDLDDVDVGLKRLRKLLRGKIQTQNQIHHYVHHILDLLKSAQYLFQNICLRIVKRCRGRVWRREARNPDIGEEVETETLGDIGVLGFSEKT